MVDGIGLTLSRNFFERCVKPIITRHDPGLRYAAARIGNGSKVLGYDTVMSADHNYGPSLLIFLSEVDFVDKGPALMEELNRELPERFDGWPVRFPSVGRPGNDATSGMLGSDHGIEVDTPSSAPSAPEKAFRAALSPRVRGRAVPPPPLPSSAQRRPADAA